MHTRIGRRAPCRAFSYVTNTVDCVTLNRRICHTHTDTVCCDSADCVAHVPRSSIRSVDRNRNRSPDGIYSAPPMFFASNSCKTKDEIRIVQSTECSSSDRMKMKTYNLGH